MVRVEPREGQCGAAEASSMNGITQADEIQHSYCRQAGRRETPPMAGFRWKVVYCIGAGFCVAVGAGVVIVLGGGATVVDGICVVCESVWLHAASANTAIPSAARRWGLEIIVVPSTAPPRVAIIGTEHLRSMFVRSKVLTECKTGAWKRKSRATTLPWHWLAASSLILTRAAEF